MAAIAQFITNRLNAQKSTSTRSLSMSLGTSADCFIQNKANFRKAQMNVNSFITKDYRKKDDFAVQKNKPKTNPIKPKTNPKQTQNEPKTNPIKPNPTAPF